MHPKQKINKENMWNENLAFVPKPQSFKHSENVYVLPFKISIQRDLKKHLRIKIDHHYTLKYNPV